MAAVLRLSDVTGATTVDLMSGTFKLRWNSFAPRTPAVANAYTHSRFGAQQHFQHYDVQVESFDLIANDTTANMLAAINAIEALLEKARLWHDDTLRSKSVWLEVGINGESVRRSLIYEGSIQYPADIAGVSVWNDKAVIARLVLSRHPLWENASNTQTVSSSISLTGGKTATISTTGTAPSRMVLEVQPSSELSKLWVGVRNVNQGVSSFNSTASFSGSFSLTTTLSYLNNVSMTNFTASNQDHMVGRYIVLLRCKVSGGTAGVQLRHGMKVYPSSLALAANIEIFVADTGGAYRLIDLGHISVPPEFYRNSDAGSDTVKNFALEVYGEIASGTPTLDADQLILIPTDHFAYVEGPIPALIDSGGAHIQTYEDDAVSISLRKGTTRQGIQSYAVRDLYWPVEGGVLVVAGEQDTGQNTGDTAQITTSLYPRWLSYRNT